MRPSSDSAVNSENYCIVDFEDLKRISNRKRPVAVTKYLQSQGIHYMLDADGRPWTTEKVLNDSVIGGKATQPNWHLLNQ